MKAFLYPFPFLRWQQWFNLLPVGCALSLFSYFSWQFHPPFSLLIAVFGCFIIILRKIAVPSLHQLWLSLLLMLVSMFLAHHYTFSYHEGHRLLSRHYYYTTIEAVAEEITVTDKGYRLLLSGIKGEELALTDKGLTIRISSRSDLLHIQPGDHLRLKATIFPPSRPSYPGSFDFGRYFYFKQISAVGYTTGQITKLSTLPEKQGAVKHLRQQIESYLLKHLTQPEAGIAIALVTGQTAAIEKETRTAFTNSGLAHILSISGLHMAIMCGGIYAIIRFGLACIPYAALRLPIRKYAALAGLISGAAYLAIADYPIPAVRAYIMVGLMFAAILCNREADSLRSLVLAALGIMLVDPASVVDISFQLSFTGVLALVLFYRRLSSRHEQWRQRYRGFIWWSLIYIMEMALTSLVAGLATTPLMIYHFNQFSVYGVLANILALPALSLLIAPGYIATFLTIPTGYAHYPLELVEIGISLMIGIANWVTAIPHASLQVPAMDGVALALLMLSLLGLLTSTSWRMGTLYSILIATSLASAWWQPVPDILVSEDRTAIAIQTSPSHWILFKGSNNNFHAEQWEQRTGHSFTPFKAVAKEGTLTGWTCSKAGCDGLAQGKHIRLRFDYKVKEPLCLPDTDIVISTFYADRWECDSSQAVRIDRSLLERYGSHALWLTPSLRMWHPCLSGKDWPWRTCTS